MRDATEPNIVIVAPTTAPTEKITARLVPRMPMKVASASLCSA